jgi:hypothetical protein
MTSDRLADLEERVARLEQQLNIRGTLAQALRDVAESIEIEDDDDLELAAKVDPNEDEDE